ncbi:LacI family DNA-binding transcriptional regulator [Fundicoccus sp. Sow4_F4]|uniref:LacI family DNA-binding transcriptional regulator n=1 Tax=Fundicoccus sp. Sow4_F4 TaxID=3438783 RepID=UPI003F8F59EA
MATTIKDIAKQANVSIATVSRVINQLGGYSQEVEENVLKIAKELNYHKNENAISLVKNVSNIIGIIMPTVDSFYYSNIVNGIEDAAKKHGYSVILMHAGVEGENFKSCLNLMAERRVDGIVAFSIFVEQEGVALVKSLNIPIVLLSTEAVEDSIPYIKVDDYSAAFEATDYLVRNGHQRIGLAGVSPIDPIAGIPRINGYRDALKQNGIPIEEELIYFGDYNFTSGKKAMEYYIQNDIALTAIFCVSDETALGVISECNKQNIIVPEDLSVIGYDNSKISSMVTPTITTISQPFYEMGNLGCESLILSILKKKEILSEIVPFTLVERNSVKKLL